jgi:hypothetical protein
MITDPMEFEHLKWYHYVNGKLSCYADEVPPKILKKFKDINKAYQSVLHKDYIQILSTRPKEKMNK